ncbi:hypothetical protein HPB47_018903 [Ixodes persulcatus]|uniref:Uncharacterized protein n=1 Tax=Ixodes persulcatus TaxID=34615 RepID=A0AC60QJJ5_IXOPE|nr:hypothetical protein HPB47_018903 [Ixodes persulcatus]
MAPPKTHAFDMTVSEGTPVDAVLDAVVALVTLPEVFSVQHMGALHFQVVVNSKAAVRKLLDAGGLSIGGNLVPLVPVGPQVTTVTVLFLPAHVPDELLVRSLAQHGKVQEITHGVYKDTPSIKTGTRVTCDYRGMKRVCRRCKKEGHFKAQCTEEYCTRCACFGHATETCAAGCRWCGAAHATVDCSARRSYSAVAGLPAEDFPALPGTSKETARADLAAAASLQRPQEARTKKTGMGAGGDAVGLTAAPAPHVGDKSPTRGTETGTRAADAIDALTTPGKQTETAPNTGGEASRTPGEENPLDQAAAKGQLYPKWSSAMDDLFGSDSEELVVDLRSDEAEEENMEKTEEPAEGKGSTCVYTPLGDKRAKAKEENARRSEAFASRQKPGLKKNRKDAKGTPYDRDNNAQIGGRRAPNTTQLCGGGRVPDGELPGWAECNWETDDGLGLVEGAASPGLLRGCGVNGCGDCRLLQGLGQTRAQRHWHRVGPKTWRLDNRILLDPVTREALAEQLTESLKAVTPDATSAWRRLQNARLWDVVCRVRIVLRGGPLTPLMKEYLAELQRRYERLLRMSSAAGTATWNRTGPQAHPEVLRMAEQTLVRDREPPVVGDADVSGTDDPAMLSRFSAHFAALARSEGTAVGPQEFVSTLAGVLGIKTLLAIVDEEENPARPLALYFLGPQRREIVPRASGNLLPSAEQPSPFFKRMLAFWRQLKSHDPELDVWASPAVRVMEELVIARVPPHRRGGMEGTEITRATLSFCHISTSPLPQIKNVVIVAVNKTKIRNIISHQCNAI